MAILTANDLRTHLGITQSGEDPSLTAAVNAVNTTVIKLCQRTFDTTTATRSYKPIHSHLVEVDDFHTTDGLVVKTDTSDDGTFDTTWASTDYQVEPLNGLVDGETRPYYKIRSVEAKTFPTLGHRASVQVTAQWGWASVPQPVTFAAKILGARLYRRKDSPEAQFAFGDFALRLAREDPDVMTLLMPYKKRAVLV